MSGDLGTLKLHIHKHLHISAYCTAAGYALLAFKGNKSLFSLSQLRQSGVLCNYGSLCFAVPISSVSCRQCNPASKVSLGHSHTTTLLGTKLGLIACLHEVYAQQKSRFLSTVGG
jgi:hypothetical protein